MSKAAQEIASAVTTGPWLKGYVRGKLNTDPVFNQGLVALCGCDGSIADLGCGLGLFGLWARKHGFENPYSGCDLSRWKIEAGQQAAQKMGLSHYALRVGDMSSFDIGDAALVLAFDVIHYLDSQAQVRLYERLAQVAQSGSTVLIRTGVMGCGWRTAVTLAHEWWTRASRWIQGGRVNFPQSEVIVSAFETRDCSVEQRPLWGRTPFSSHLFEIRRR
jgi:cyclopropane fatty-acyl-phospholipid synthase-like methyltransferase